MTAAAIYAMRLTAYGRRLAAVGQNDRAAHLAGVRVGLLVSVAFATSSLLAAVDGWLLDVCSGGAFFDMVKSLASGGLMAKILFPGAAVGAVVLPLMIFHQIQLFASATLAQRYPRRPLLGRSAGAVGLSDPLRGPGHQRPSRGALAAGRGGHVAPRFGSPPPLAAKRTAEKF